MSVDLLISIQATALQLTCDGTKHSSSGPKECLRNTNLIWRNNETGDDYSDELNPSNKETGQRRALIFVSTRDQSTPLMIHTAIAKLCRFSFAMAIKPPNKQSPMHARTCCDRTCPNLRKGPIRISPKASAVPVVLWIMVVSKGPPQASLHRVLTYAHPSKRQIIGSVKQRCLRGP